MKKHNKITKMAPSNKKDNPNLDLYQASGMFKSEIDMMKQGINPQLKNYVPDFWTDVNYMRFLRARNMDVTK